MEEMRFWILFWHVLLIAAMAVFAGLAIAVTIGGLFDIRAMFRSIAAHQDEEERAVSADS